jgi:hypothetical protein
MVRGRLALAAAILAALALPLAGAVGFDASSLSTPSSTVSADSPLVDWQTNGVEAGRLRFTLTASRIGMETDTAHYLQVGLTAYGAQPPATSTARHDDATVHGSNWGNHTSLFLVPRFANATLTVTSLGVAVPVMDCVQQRLYMQGSRQAECPDVANAVVLDGSLGSGLVAGDFDVYLWGWRGTIEDGGGTSEHWSGSQDTQQAGLTAGPSERRFVKLGVHGGSLRFEADATRASVYTPQATLALERAAVANGGVVGLGNATVQVTRDGRTLDLDVQRGQVHHASGETTVVAPAGGPGRAGFAWWVAGLALPALLAAVTAQRARGHLQRAADNLAMGNPNAAHRHAVLAARYPWSRRRGDTLAAIALLRARRLDEAERHLAACRRRGMDAAAADFLDAYLAAARGDAAAALQALRRSVAANPGYLQEARHHELLQGVATRLEAQGDWA